MVDVPPERNVAPLFQLVLSKAHPQGSELSSYAIFPFILAGKKINKTWILYKCVKTKKMKLHGQAIFN